jgi:hypothetical protein
MQIELYEYNVVSGEESLQITINVNYLNDRVTGVIGNDFNNSIRVYKDGDYLRIYANGYPNRRYRGAFYSLYNRVILGGLSQIAINPPLGEEVTTIKRDYYRKINATLEINDNNLSEYYTNSVSIFETLTIPIDVETIVFNTSNEVKISAIQIPDVFNGKRITLIGQYFSTSEHSANTSVDGRFSEYLYEHKYGQRTGSAQSSNDRYTYEQYLYYKGIWYSKGY